METESQVAHQSRQRQIVKLKTETDQLLKDREEELKTLDTDVTLRLEIIEKQTSEAKTSLKSLELEKAKRLMELTGLHSEAQSARQDISELREHQTTEEGTLQALRAKQHGVLESIDGLKSQITPLIEKLQEAETHQADLTQENKTLMAQITQSTTEYEAQQTKRLQTKQVLESQIAHMEDQIREMQIEQQVVREDLSRRIKLLDERETVLKRREFKVERDESTVKRNATLLDL